MDALPLLVLALLALLVMGTVVVLAALGLGAAVRVVVAAVQRPPAPRAQFPLTRLPELEGADEDLRRAYDVYAALLAAVEVHRFGTAPELELDRADGLAQRAEAPIARAARRLAPERAQALAQMRAAASSARQALVTSIARSSRRLGVAPAAPRTQLGALALLEGGALFCGARQRAWVVGAALAVFVTQKAALPLPAFVTPQGLAVLATWLAAGGVFVVAAWLRPGVGRVVLTGVSLFALASVLLGAADTLWLPSLLPVAGCFLWWARARLSGPRTA